MHFARKISFLRSVTMLLLPRKQINLNTVCNKFWWACFSEDHPRTICLLCMKHRAKSPRNKATNAFVEVPSKRCEIDTLKCHMTSGIHATNVVMSSCNLCLKFTRRMWSTFFEVKQTVREEAFTTCYFINLPVSHSHVQTTYEEILSLQSTSGIPLDEI